MEENKYIKLFLFFFPFLLLYTDPTEEDQAIIGPMSALHDARDDKFAEF